MNIRLDEKEGWGVMDVDADTTLTAFPAEDGGKPSVSIIMSADDIGEIDAASCWVGDREDWERFKAQVEEMFAYAEALPKRPPGYGGITIHEDRFCWECKCEENG